MNDEVTARRPGSFPNFPWLAGRVEQALSANETGSDGVPDKDPRRAGFIQDLIKQLDVVIFCQISVLCYMDCSLWRFAFRLGLQRFFSGFESRPFLLPTTNRAHLASVVYSNLICAFLHIALDLPQGNELSRGYVHGTFLIDFVGEPAPSSKLKMVLIDICIFVLQLLMLSAVLESKRLKVSTGEQGSLNGLNDTQRLSNRQDLDAEEQGIRRSQEGLASDHIPTENAAAEPDREDILIINESYSGQMVVLAVDPLATIRNAWKPQYGQAIRRSHA